MSNEIETKYSSYVHISNSGYNFEVEVTELDNTHGPYQYLTLSLQAFGLPLSTQIWLDDNVLDGLEYVLKKAREQREYFVKDNFDPRTNLAIPPHTHESRVSDSTESNNDAS